MFSTCSSSCHDSSLYMFVLVIFLDAVVLPQVYVAFKVLYQHIGHVDWGVVYKKLDEDGDKKMIFKMARDITEDGTDVTRGAVIKDNNGRLITESEEVLKIWAANFKELLNGKGTSSCLELPSSVSREVEVEEIGQEEVETTMHNMKKARRQWQMKYG